MRDAVRPRVPLPPVRHEARHRHGPARGGPPRPGRDAEALRVLHRAARVLLEDLPDLTDRLLAVLSEEEPAYRALLESDPGPTWQEVRRSLRHSVGSLLDPRACRDAARRCSWQIGGTRAEQGMPLDALLHAFRLGGSLVWQALVDETSRIAPDEVRLLVHVAGDVWSFVDEHCTLVADAYRQVERQLTWRHENRLRLMTAALLDGSTRIADLPEVAAALDLPERGRYAVVAVASAHAAAYGAGHPVPPPPGMRVRWHVGTDTEYGIVLVGDGDPAALAREPQAPPGTRTGVSSVVDGLAAVGDARRLAETALRICPGTGGTVLLDEHLPAALVVSSPALGAALAERVLGPLLRLDPADRDLLLDTLAAWLECDGSARRAGSRLYCHRNTVLNRLRRCEQLTGRSLSRPADVAEFSLALVSRRLLDR